MNQEKLQTIEQRENGKRKLLRQLAATARSTIIYEVGLPFGVWKMNRLINWLEQSNVHVDFPVFKEYWSATTAIPTGKERLYCSREALRSYDERLYPINLEYHDRIIDACLEIIEIYGEVLNNQETSEHEKENASE